MGNTCYIVISYALTAAVLAFVIVKSAFDFYRARRDRDKAS
jgi:heme exporter protein CcmD